MIAKGRRWCFFSNSVKKRVIVTEVGWRKGKLSLIGGLEQYGGIFEYGNINLVLKIRNRKFAISHKETGLYLTFSFTLFEIEFNPPVIKNTAVRK